MKSPRKPPREGIEESLLGELEGDRKWAYKRGFRETPGRNSVNFVAVAPRSSEASSERAHTEKTDSRLVFALACAAALC